MPIFIHMHMGMGAVRKGRWRQRQRWGEAYKQVNLLWTVDSIATSILKLEHLSLLSPALSVEGHHEMTMFLAKFGLSMTTTKSITPDRSTDRSQKHIDLYADRKG